MSDSIYLDFAAATPVDPRVFDAMEPYYRNKFYNPSALYRAAHAVRADYEAARSELAGWFGAKPSSIVLTSGATESNNLAVHGVMQSFAGRRIAVGAIEHASIVQAAEQHLHDFIDANSHGRITPEALKKTVHNDTVLVSIGAVNSELGTVQQMRQLASVVREINTERVSSGNNLPLYFHTDATGAANYSDLQVSRLGVDLLTLGSSKIYGPPRAGLLYVKTGTKLQPLTHGGGQESGLRSGTENVAGVVGFAKALTYARQEKEDRLSTVSHLRLRFTEKLNKALGADCTTVPTRFCAPHIAHFHFNGIDAETLVYLLDERGVMVATGAACAANKDTASHVLKAIGLSPEAIQGSIRCSFSHTQTVEQMDRAAHIFTECVQKLREGR